MSIGVADQHIEDQAVDKVGDIKNGCSGPVSKQGNAGAKRRASLCLVLSLRGGSQCLAEVLLVESGRPAIFICLSIISLNQNARFLSNRTIFRVGYIQSDSPRQSHAEHFVGGQSRKTIRFRFHYVGAGGIAEREAYSVVTHDDREFVLSAGERES